MPVIVKFSAANQESVPLLYTKWTMVPIGYAASSTEAHRDELLSNTNVQGVTTPRSIAYSVVGALGRPPLPMRKMPGKPSTLVLLPYS